MGETQRLVWLLSNPVCAEVNNALQEYTSVLYSTTDQHKETTTACKRRDTNDTRKLLVFLQSKDPFDPRDANLHSIDTGIIAAETVNVDKAVVAVGQKILDGMIGHGVLKYVSGGKIKLCT